jgi:hypothetical protein
MNIEIRGSGFSAKSSDFLPPKWSKNAGSRPHIFSKTPLLISYYYRISTPNQRRYLFRYVDFWQPNSSRQ